MQGDVEYTNTELNMSDGGILKKRKRQKILRYVRFNKQTDENNYYRELVMLFHPWRKENLDIPSSYTMVKELYDKNSASISAKRLEYEKQCSVLDLVENLINNEQEEENSCNNDFMPECQHRNEQDFNEGQTIAEKYGCFDPGKQLNYDVALDIGITRKQISDDDLHMHKLPETEYREMVRSLNPKQKAFFYHILHWFKSNDKPLYNFLSGGAGVGKSVVTKAIYQGLIRCLNVCPGSNPDEVKVILCAPTGKAAHNINGNTIHSTFCIPANSGFTYKPLDMEQLNIYRLKYKELRVILIDEISMVGCKMFNFINCRLQEIMGTQERFGGVSIIAIGDLFQLKPVMDGWIFSSNTTEYGVIAENLWVDNFQLFELNTIMRQKDDVDFAKLLNGLREGIATEHDISVLKSKVMLMEDADKSWTHLFTTRKEVDNFNEDVFNSISNSKTAVIDSIDCVTGDLDEKLHENAMNRIPQDSSKNDGPTYKIESC